MLPLTGQTYTIGSVAGATTYTWTVPVGWTITAGAGTTSITVTTGAAGQNGNITVTAGNSCGTSAAQSLAVTVVSTPATPGAITGTADQCPALTGQTTPSALLPVQQLIHGTCLPAGQRPQVPELHQ